MHRTATNPLRDPRLLALAGAVIALPSFVINWAAHDGSLPDVDDPTRLDGVMSLVLMIGAGLVVSALLLARPAPVGRRGRWLLVVEAAMVTLAAAWSVWHIADPNVDQSGNIFLIVSDACWPLHQVFMIVPGIVAIRARQWPAPARFGLLGPVAGLLVLGVGASIGVDLIAAIGIGAGWAVAGLATFVGLRPQESELPVATAALAGNR